MALRLYDAATMKEGLSRQRRVADRFEIGRDHFPNSKLTHSVGIPVPGE
jgi:hypothetical protein